MKSQITLSLLQNLLKKIPKRHVTTYQDIAQALGNPKAARAVGRLCGKNPDPDLFPCYKVVRSDGTPGGYALGIAEKKKRLSKDGIRFSHGKIVDFDTVRFSFS